MYEPRPTEGTSLDSAISEIDAIKESHPDQKVLIESIKASLEDIRDQLSASLIDNEAACAFLFDLYCHFQMEMKDIVRLPGILRVVGDDLGYQLGVDDDELWAMYQASLGKHS